MTITNGQDRLTLQNEGGYFRALVWSSEQGREWVCRAIITQSDFQHGCDKRRWVNALHSFEPATGHAIIKVGEDDVRFGEGVHNEVVRCIYSWREWDLLNNREVRLLRVCYDPHEHYDPALPIKNETDSLVIIDCKDEHWDSLLCDHLYNRRTIELRNLHSSYEEYMKQLAAMHSMEFVAHLGENRGEFKPSQSMKAGG